jgi:hypothetical protein
MLRHGRRGGRAARGRPRSPDRAAGSRERACGRAVARGVWWRHGRRPGLLLVLALLATLLAALAGRGRAPAPVAFQAACGTVPVGGVAQPAGTPHLFERAIDRTKYDLAATRGSWRRIPLTGTDWSIPHRAPCPDEMEMDQPVRRPGKRWGRRPGTMTVRVSWMGGSPDGCRDGRRDG